MYVDGQTFTAARRLCKSLLKFDLGSRVDYNPLCGGASCLELLDPHKLFLF